MEPQVTRAIQVCRAEDAMRPGAGGMEGPVPVLLLQPPGTCQAFTRSGSSYPPLGLCQVAATLPREQVRVLDADGLGWDDAETLAALEAAAPRIVGLTATSFTLEGVEVWAARCRARSILTVVGGPHASLAPADLAARCPSVDIIIRGEGEVVFPTLVEALLAGRRPALPGVCHTGGGRLHVAPEIPQVLDFEHHPFPRMEGLPIERYWCPDAKRRPMVTVMTTRGCPHRCGFCSSPAVMGRKLRGFPVEAVLDELAYLWALGVREISFVDDVFTLDRRRALALCRGMEDRGLDLSWFCNARADQVTPELAGAMARAGCHQVYLGFESGAQAILDRIHKGTTVDRLERGAALLAEAGIARSVGFVLGLPGESDETVEASIALARRVRPERLQFTRFTPLPGTPLFQEVGPGQAPIGFHTKGEDPVGAWIGRAYEACGSTGWGRESW